MIYRLRYYSDFYDIHNNKYRVEIYRKTDEIIESKELTLSSQAITIQYNSDELFQPLKQSGCTINVLTKDILIDLYTGQLNNITCKIFKNDFLLWYGFLTPNAFGSEFQSNLDLVSLKFIDVISHLGNIKFVKSDNAISSFYDVMVKAFSTIDTEHVINHIYTPNSLQVDGYSDILKRLYIQDRNFLDEEEEPQTYKEVLEDIMRYLGMTLTQYEDKFLILDYEFIKAGDYHYTIFKIDDDTSELKELEKDYRTLTDLGVANANASISLGNIYNKVTIVANSNPIGDIVPELFDDLTNQNSDANKEYTVTYNDYTYLLAYFNSSKWVDSGCWNNSIQFKDITPSDLAGGEHGIYNGVFFNKCFNFKTVDGKPSSRSWTDYLSFVAYVAGTKKKSTISYTKSNVVFKGGYFIFDLKYMLSKCPAPQVQDFSNTFVKAEDYANAIFTGKFLDTKFPIILKIGDLYFNGDTWQSEECTFYAARKNKEGDKLYNTTYQLTNQVQYTENLINSGDGILIALPENQILSGDLYFAIEAPNGLGTAFSHIITGQPTTDVYIPNFCHVSELKFIHTTKNEHIDVFNDKNNENDVLYENVIDSSNITEFDDISMKVNTYSPVIASYSYVLKKLGEQFDFVDNINRFNSNAAKAMEEFIINKYVEYYSSPKFIYSNTLNNKSVSPFTIVHSDVLNKDMIVDAISYDLSNDSIDVVLKEI